MDDAMKYYAGIGSRITPKDVLVVMQDLGTLLAKQQYTLRSGAARGADTAFESGCDSAKGKKEIFLPWGRFNGHTSQYVAPTPEALILAEGIHPAFKFLTYSSKNLVARNMHQVLGYDLNTPVEFIICWTPDGCETIEQYTKETGGTGSAITCGALRGVPVYNLQRPGRLQQLLDFIEGT
jgi:hypothetical protein